jgi:outer membrane protein OmpA-like peptidoglycan-associated protein
MRHLVCITLSTLALIACGAGSTSQAPATAAEPAPAAAAGAEVATGSADAAAPSEAEQTDPGEFVLRSSDAATSAQRSAASKIKPTRTEAALKFFVVDKDKGAIKGVVVSLTGADGKKYYTEETDAEGFAEVLVPVGQKYELVYLSLGRRDIAANVTVTDEPNQTVRLTLRYKRYESPTPAAPEPHFVLEGVNFDSGKAVIRPESLPRLDSVVEYMTYKKSARIEITGHTDNQGNVKVNKALSQKRAEACRDYLVSKGIDKSRVEAHGYGDERPIASNDTEAGRQTNRRIEATEL